MNRAHIFPPVYSLSLTISFSFSRICAAISSISPSYFFLFGGRIWRRKSAMDCIEPRLLDNEQLPANKQTNKTHLTILYVFYLKFVKVFYDFIVKRHKTVVFIDVRVHAFQ